MRTTRQSTKNIMQHSLQTSFHRSWTLLLLAGWILVSLGGCPSNGPAPQLDIKGGEDIVQADCVGDSCVEAPCQGGCAIGVCHPELEVCVACLEDEDCGGSKCHPVTNSCVQCYEDSQCPGGKCTEELVCVQCTSDLDCGAKGSCNPDTNTCEGECSNDKTCDDGNECTIDSCSDGSCIYENAEDGTPCDDGDKCTLTDQCLQGSCLPGDKNPECCKDVICSAFQKGKDTNGDGCIDTCYCPDEKLPAECPKGSVGVDNDGDGCLEACECTDPSCLPCASDSDCNLEGNPCSSGTCVVGACEISTKEKCCVTGCDCYKLAKVNITCDSKEVVPHWTCQENTCIQVCDELPDDIKQCICKPLTCQDGQSPVDLDNDGCDDTCLCGTLTCDKGLVPSDTDEDGCDDTCVCDALKCDKGLEGFDTNGNGCPDICACPGGAIPDKDGCPTCKTACDCYEEPLKSATVCFGAVDAFHWACENSECTATCGIAPNDVKQCMPCMTPILCKTGTSAVDTDKDGCPDTCLCPDGNEPGLNGKCSCIKAEECLDTTKAIDSNQDGCVDWCQCGSGALVKPGDECPCLASISCDADKKPVDTDGDGCHDACACDEEGCQCKEDEDCKGQSDCVDVACFMGTCTATNLCCKPIADCPKGAAQIDTTGDGCPDTCECAAGQKPGADNCSCLIEISCLDGFEVIDTNDDGCGDTCAQPCKATCDCYKDAQPQNQSCVFLSPAQDQGVLWVCEQGYCQEECGTYTDEHFKCIGCIDPVTKCPDGETPTDTTGDGCPDSCPSAECKDACDCYAEAIPDPQACDDVDCKNCKSAWTCNKGTCQSACLADEEIEQCVDSNVVCKQNSDCPTASHFCLKLNTGQCKELGQCTLMPENCDDAVGTSVCGCDNKTYATACDAYMAGTSLQKEEACK